MPQGTAIVDFGAYPGSVSASLAVTGQGTILSGSLVEAWVFPVATADHTADEHIIDPPALEAGSVIVSTGFTIYAQAPGLVPLYGKYTAAWAWN